MKKLLLAISMMALSITVQASKAHTVPFTAYQVDGTQLTVILQGDEYMHWATTTDSVLLYQIDRNYYIAAIDGNGHISSTGILAHEKTQRSPKEQQLVLQQSDRKSRFFNQASIAMAKRTTRREPVQTTSTLFPHTGSPKALVIMVNFKDVTFSVSHPKEQFEQYLNGETLQDYGNADKLNLNSVSNYFKQVSFGQFTPKFDLYGPVTVSHDMAYYGRGSYENVNALVDEACSLLDSQIDFTQYDSNGDGYIDLVYVIYAGYGENMGNNSTDCIWPKSWNRYGTTTYDGKKIGRCGVSNELNADPSTKTANNTPYINGIGLFCHEFSHCLGLPDFYPTLSTAHGDNQGMEDWSLMDNGEYVSNGYKPTAYTAWEREAMGWMNIETLTTDQTITNLQPVAYNGKAYKIMNENDATGKEYYVLENIQNVGQNKGLKGSGLLVYHVNYDAYAFSLSSNSVNNVKGKPKMTVVPADNLLYTSYNVNSAADQAAFLKSEAGDPFGNTVTCLNDTMQLVNFAPYSGIKLNKALRNIVNSASTRLVSFDYLADFATGIKGIDSKEEKIGRGRIYSLDGRFLGYDATRLPRGLYIINHKKIVLP